MRNRSPDRSPSHDLLNPSLLSDFDNTRRYFHPVDRIGSIQQSSSSLKENTSHRALVFTRIQVYYFQLKRSTQIFILLGLLALSFLLVCKLCDSLFYSYGYSLSNVSQDGIIVPSIAESTYAVVINTYKRPDMLRTAVKHYADVCGRKYGIAQVFVVWAEIDVDPPSPDLFFINDDTHSIPTGTHKRSKTSETTEKHLNRSTVTVIRASKNSLNSRFLPIQNLQSTGVFMVDDDLRVECNALVRAFQAWTYHPLALVGFYPRLSSLPRSVHRSSSGKDRVRSVLGDQWVYHTWPITFLHSKFNIILTKACFLHKMYLEMYSDHSKHPQEILDYVDQNKNCEDIAMAFLVANHTREDILNHLQSSKTSPDHHFLKKTMRRVFCASCPVYVQGKVDDLGLFNGISTGKGGAKKISGHMDKRNLCLETFSKIYRNHSWDFPLVDFPLGENSWTHHSPGFWWQHQPSNFFEWLSFGNTFS